MKQNPPVDAHCALRKYGCENNRASARESGTFLYTPGKKGTMKKRIFDSLEEVTGAFGEGGIIPITSMKQMMFYISRYQIQPVWICPSTTNEGKMAYYFIKAETKKPYEEWMKTKGEI